MTTQRIEFIIIGRISPAHRATQFRDKYGVRRSFPNKEYEASRKLIQLAGILNAKTYVQPIPKTTTRVYVHFYVGTHTFVRRKNGTTYWKGRSQSDADNLCKAILDGLQGIFYANDKWAVPLPFESKKENDNPYITRFDNRAGNRPDWTEVSIESVPGPQQEVGWPRKAMPAPRKRR